MPSDGPHKSPPIRRSTLTDRPVEPRYQWLLRLVSKPTWFVACALAVVTLALQFYQNARLQVRMELVREQEQHLKNEVAALNLQASRRNDRVQAIAKDVNAELGNRHQRVLAMAEMLSRARGLEQQHDRFDELRKEIDQHLKKMDTYYVETQQQTGAALP